MRYHLLTCWFCGWYCHKVILCTRKQVEVNHLYCIEVGVLVMTIFEMQNVISYCDNDKVVYHYLSLFTIQVTHFTIIVSVCCMFLSFYGVQVTHIVFQHYQSQYLSCSEHTKCFVLFCSKVFQVSTQKVKSFSLKKFFFRDE